MTPFAGLLQAGLRVRQRQCEETQETAKGWSDPALPTSLSRGLYDYRPNSEAGLPVFGTVGNVCPPFGDGKGFTPLLRWNNSRAPGRSCSVRMRAFAAVRLWPIFNPDSNLIREGGFEEPQYADFVPPADWQYQCPACGARQPLTLACVGAAVMQRTATTRRIVKGGVILIDVK